jgi:type II secretory pathway pseudopilin PulG
VFPVRRSRGFSVIEVIVAMSLAAGLGMVVATVIASSTAASKDAIARADASEDVRTLNDLLARFVQAGVRKPECLQPDNRNAAPLTFAACIVPGQGGDVLETASAEKIVFYSYPDASAGPAAPRAPDKVTVETSRDAATNAVTLTVSAQSPDDATIFYVGAGGYGSPRILRTVILLSPTVAALEGAACPPPSGTPPSTQVFAFFDAEGSSTTDPSKVSVVAFDPRVKVVQTGETCPRTVSSPVYLAFPSQGFGR